MWAVLDYSADALYLLDTVAVKPRVMFLGGSGIYETGRLAMIENYVRKGSFKRDALSLLPLDLLYFFFGFNGRAALLRLPRLLRYRRFWDLFERLNTFQSYPAVVR